MIYTYKHLNHKIENFHSNIAYFFKQLFTHDLAVYNEKVLLKTEFIPIVNSSRISLKANLIKITEVYHKLSSSEKDRVKEAFNANSNIEKLCNDIAIIPYKYDDLPAPIRDILKDFLTKLWVTYPQNNLLAKLCGTVQEHFTAFVSNTHQKALICPFCGLNKLKTSESINRDAYDHYIPKAIYPFISINFCNLFPICHECNSDEKKTIDTLYDGVIRRKVFYPLDSGYSPDQLSISVLPIKPYNPLNLKTLLRDISWEYSFAIEGNTDSRLTAWDSIFHVKRRYRENVLVYQTEWYEEILIRYKRELAKGTSFEKFKDEILDDAEFMKLIAPFGLCRLSYFKFLFSIPDIEDKMNDVI